MAFYTIRVSTMYPVFVDDKATVTYIFELYLTEQLFSMKMKSEVDFVMA